MDALDKARERLTGWLKGGSGASPKIESAEDQSPDEKKLVSYVNEKVTEARQHASRVAHEGIWLTNIAYLLGYDSVYYDTGTRAFKTLDGSGEIARRGTLSVNKILPTIQNRLARLCKNPPKYDVRPNSESNDDKEAARLSMKVLRNVWDVQKIDEKRLELYMWLQQCGHSYIKVSWDDEMGELLPDPMTVTRDLLEQAPAETTDVLHGTDQAPTAPGSEPGATAPGGLINEETSLPEDPEQKLAELMYEGDIRVDVVSAFEVFVDPLAKTLDEAAHLVHAKLRRLDYFKQRYPERGHLVKPEGNIVQSLQYEQRINSLNSAGPLQSGNPSEATRNAATEIAYYERRSKKYPRGRLVVIANGILLEDKQLPVGEIPFAKFDDVLIAGKYFSEAVITHMRPLQDCYNTNKTKRMRWLELMLAGKYVAARGHGLAMEGLDNESGEVVEYDPVPNAQEPHALQPPTVPQYAFTESDVTEKEMYDIAGINEISRGQLPAAGIPAVGMQFLAEQDDTRVGVVTEQHEHAWARVGKLILLYANAFYKTKRKLKEAAKDRSYRVKDFTGEDLRNNCDVIVIRGSTLPGSKVLRRQEIVNAWQQGMLGDPADPTVRYRVLEMLEWGDLAEMWHDQALDLAQIDWKLNQVEAVQMPPVHEMDNHKLTIEELNRYRKTEKYQRLGTIVGLGGVTAQQVFDQLLEAHLQEAMKLQSPQYAAAQATSPEEMAMAQGGHDPATQAGAVAEMVGAADGGAPAPEGDPALALSAAGPQTMG